MKEISRPPTLTAIVADSIRETIFRGELKPGAPLREVELSDTLNVSRGTVREALRLLQEEWLVEIIPFRGAFVTRPTPRTVREVYGLRALLEAYAMRLAMDSGGYGDGDLDALEKLVHRMDALEVAGDMLRASEADLEFHRLLCARSDQKLLLHTFHNIQSLSRLCMLNSPSYRPNPAAAHHHHHTILDAIRQGDPSTTEEIVRGHITESGEALLTGMEEVDETDLYAHEEEL